MTYEEEIEMARQTARKQLKHGSSLNADDLVRDVERIANIFRCTFEEVAVDLVRPTKSLQWPPGLIHLVMASHRKRQPMADTLSHRPPAYDAVGQLDCWSISDSSKVYFAFVEDLNRFDADFAESNEVRRACWGGLMSVRKDQGIPKPQRLVWFDAVRASFFMRLPWREDVCPIGDVQASALRRRNLLSLGDNGNVFRSFAVPLCVESEFELSCIRAFQPCSWHVLMLGDQSGAPVAVLPDFAIDNHPDAPIQNMMYAGTCREEETANLKEIFSLNFLPDLGVRGDAQ